MRKLSHEMHICFNNIIPLLIFAALLIPIFFKLGFAPLNSGDEALFGMRAIHMAETDTYLADFGYFPGMRKYPNHKPPVTTFFQAISYRLIGKYDLELSLRLPIALCIVGAIITFIYFGKLVFNDSRIGVVSAMILITTPGFMLNHIARTCDQDGALSFYMLLAALSFYAFSDTSSPLWKKRSFTLLTLTTFLCVFTKDIYGFLFVPGFYIFLLFRKKHPWKELKAITVCVFIVAGLWLIYLFYMDSEIKGFLENLTRNAWGRYFVEIGHNRRPFYYYFYVLATKNFLPYIFILPLVAIVLTSDNKKIKDFFIFLLILLSVFILTISLSVTKLEWYLAPAYPLLAMIVAITIITCLDRFSLLLTTRSIKISRFYFSIGLLLFFCTPYFNILKSIDANAALKQESNYVVMIKNAPSRDFHILAFGNNPHLALYTYYYNKSKGYNINLNETWNSFHRDDIVLICNKLMIKRFKERYFYDSLIENGDGLFAKVIEIK